MTFSTTMVNSPQSLAGALVGVGVHRVSALGGLAIVPTPSLIGTADAVTQWYTPSTAFVSNRLVGIGTLPLPVLIVINLACCAAALAMAWPVAGGAAAQHIALQPSSLRKGVTAIH